MSLKLKELVKSDVIASAFIFGSKNCFPVDLKAKEKAEVLFIERKEFFKIIIFTRTNFREFPK